MGGLFTSQKLWQFPSNNNIAGEISDANDLRNGVYRNYPKMKNTPIEGEESGAIIIAFSVNDVMALQLCKYHSSGLFIRTEWGGGKWSGWKQIAIAD